MNVTDFLKLLYVNPYVGGRGVGKTYRTIVRASIARHTIVCANNFMCDNLKRQAMDMKKNGIISIIPEIIGVEDALSKPPIKRNILFDELGMIDIGRVIKILENNVFCWYNWTMPTVEGVPKKTILNYKDI